MISVGALVTGDDSVNELSAALSNRLNAHEDTMVKLGTVVTENHEAIETERLYNVGLFEKFIELEGKVSDQQTKISILESRGDVTTQPSNQPTPTSTIDLRLKISDNKGNQKSGYPRDVPAILIQGESSTFKKSFLITIKDPNGAFVKDKFGETLSDGDISEAWIPSANPVAGTYIVTIKIDLKSDSISFVLL